MTVPRLAAIERSLTSRAPRREDFSGAAEAAVSLILAPGGSGPELLLIQRAVHPLDPWSGQIGLPGGRRDPEDPDLLAAAIREAREEVGVGLDPASLLGELDDLRPRGRRLPPVVIRPFVFGIAEKPRLVLSGEAPEAFWTPLDALRETDAEVDVLARGERLRVPAYQAEGKVIWGITRRILDSLLELQ